MMIKNEEKVILRCLNSVKDLVDYFFIVDTGSTDNTIELVRNYFSENNLKGEIVERPWRNFGENKTEALQLAKNKSDYVIWLDADDVVLSNGFNKNKLVADSYYVRYDGELDYCQLRILNNRIDWKCMGVVHTYPFSAQAKTQDEIKELKIKTYDDGSTKRDDIKTLSEALEKEPNNKRYWFYLAQSYKDAKRYQEAINCYLKRISLGGWEEEIYYSYYKIGYCFEMQNLFDDAKKYYLQAWEYRPSRAEPLYRLALLCRKLKDYNQAYLFSKKGLEISYPKDLLFIEKNCYNYLLLFEKSIAAYYVGNYRESYEDCLKIIEMNEVSKEIKNQTKLNLKFSEEKIKII